MVLTPESIKGPYQLSEFTSDHALIQARWMVTYESAAFRDLSIPPVGRAVVAGGHRSGGTPFHLTLARASRQSIG